MARSWSKTTTFDASADELLDLLLDEGFLVEQHKLDKAVIEATVEERSRSETRVVQLLHSTEYGRGIKGLDKSKRERSTVTFEWDLPARKCSWTYKGEHGDRVRVWGEDRVEAAGERARLTTVWNLEVKIPIVGGQVEKLILKEVEEGRKDYEDLVRRHLADRG